MKPCAKRSANRTWNCPLNGLVVGSGGNVSGRDPGTGLVVIKPSGVKFSKLTPDKLVVIDLEGAIVEGDLKPSVDTGIHLYIYKRPAGRVRHHPYSFALCHQLRCARRTHSPPS